MSRLRTALASIVLLASFAGVVRAEPAATATVASRELLWFEAPLPVAPAARRKASRPRIKLSAGKSRYGNITLESLAARERGLPAVDCALSCAGPKIKRAAKHSRREQRISDLHRAVQLFR